MFLTQDGTRALLDMTSGGSIEPSALITKPKWNVQFEYRKNLYSFLVTSNLVCLFSILNRLYENSGILN